MASRNATIACSRRFWDWSEGSGAVVDVISALNRDIADLATVDSRQSDPYCPRN